MVLYLVHSQGTEDSGLIMICRTYEEAKGCVRDYISMRKNHAIVHEESVYIDIYSYVEGEWVQDDSRLFTISGYNPFD